MKKKYDIYGIGAALVDTEITLKDSDLKTMQVEKGVMTLVGEERQNELIAALKDHLVASKKASGGSAANAVIAASYFGGSNFFSCKVADDENGDLYLKDLKAAGIQTPPQIQVKKGITGKCLVMITPDAERTMNTYLGVSELVSTHELDLSVVEDSSYVYLEGYLVTSETGKAAAIALREKAEECSVLVAISLSDPAMAQYFRSGLLEMMGDGIDLLFCNQDEAMAFTQTSNIEIACEELKKFTKKYAITCGAQASILFDGEKITHVDAQVVKAIDTNGAGDMFAGAFIYCLTHGYTFTQAGQFANLAAAKVVSQYGPRLLASQHKELKLSLNQ